MRLLTANSRGCGISYQRIVETTTDVAPVAPVVEQTAVSSTQPSSKRKREAEPEDDDEPRHFRRVRVKCHLRARKESHQSTPEVDSSSEFEEGMMMCICGMQGKNPSTFAPSPDARLVQCVACKIWQHRSCVGTANGSDPAGGWYCGQCSAAGLEYLIKCICGSNEDDGNTVYCDSCNTWQHTRCFHPGLSHAELQSLDHFCADCDPRPPAGASLREIVMHVTNSLNEPLTVVSRL